MQNVIYLDDFRLEKISTEINHSPLQVILDSLGNNFMAMLWLTNLAHAELDGGGNQESAKKYLRDALRAGDSAKTLLRIILNSQEPHNL